MTKPAPAPTGNALKKRHFYRFGPFRLEPEERALFRNGKDLKLTGKPFDILLVLVKNRGHLLRRDQIIHEVWSASISEGNLDVQMTKVRKTLKEKYIEAIPGQGFRFIAEVTEGFEEDSIGASPPASRNLTAWRSVVSIVIVTASGVLYLALHRKTQTIPQDTHPAAVLYRKALDYERAGDDDQAVATLDQALTQDPSYKDACVRAAYLAYELGQIPKASGYLTRCKATEAPDEALRLKAQALSQLLADNTIAAMELYQLLIDRYPRDTDAQYRFSEVATSLDRIEEAEKAVGVCLALEPENPYCRFQLMYIRIKQNRFDDVLVDYRSLPSGIRDYPWFDEPVGVAFWGNGQLDEATKTFERLSGRRGLHGTSQFTFGKEWVADILLYQGRVKEGTKRLQQMIETKDNASLRSGEFLYFAEIYALVGNVEGARKFANEGVTAAGDPGDLSAGALVLASIGDSNGVERALKLRSQTTSADLSPANYHFIYGLLALAKGNAANGVEEIRLARDLNPRDEEATYWLGMAYFRAGDYKSALAMFQAVRDLKGAVLLDNVPPLLLPLSTYHIAECYERMGDPKAAKPYYDEVAKIWAAADDDVKPKSSALRSNATKNPYFTTHKAHPPLEAYWR